MTHIGGAVAGSYTDDTMHAMKLAPYDYMINTVFTTHAVTSRHNLDILFTQSYHIDGTFFNGVQGKIPWPTFVAAHAATNIVGHYICEQGTP